MTATHLPKKETPAPICRKGQRKDFRGQRQKIASESCGLQAQAPTGRNMTAWGIAPSKPATILISALKGRHNLCLSRCGQSEYEATNAIMVTLKGVENVSF